MTKVDRCALVASLLATDPHKSDALGKELTQELYAIFRREREEGVQPVLKEDVAEVLRRRFFTPGSLQQRDTFRAHVVAALQGINALDEQTAHEGLQAEQRFLSSYPFHPDLTEILYTKWTNLEGFQRTRGVLRTFALALRDAEAWDHSPLIGANVFLGSTMLYGDPLFVDPDNWDYHIGMGSPAINAGVYSGIATDLDGQARVADPDIGAYEGGCAVYLPLVLRSY